jgi:hypothetical protein
LISRNWPGARIGEADRMLSKVELPIRYFETSTMMAAFPASSRKLQLLTPAPLKVVELWPGRTPVGIMCFDYRSTTVGAYGEVGIAWPVVLDRAAPPLLPLLFETRWPGLGWWVHRLPVTTDLALHAGRSIWGYPKLLASIEFSWRDATRTCTLAEGGAEILRLDLETRMPARPRRFPLSTYTVLGSELLRTRIDVDAVGLRRRFGGKARLHLGPHAHGRELADLELALDRPVEVGWFPVWRAVLPAAEWRRAQPALSAPGVTRGAA